MKKRIFERIIGCSLLIMGLAVGGCSTPKAVEEHHYHHYEADTAAVEAMIDRKMNAWHERVDSSWRKRFDEYRSEWSAQSDEKEVTTETVTTATDSLGREIRTEQRRTERTLSQQQQATAQRLTREMESRLTRAVDSLDAVWQQRYDSLATHVARTDSALISKTPVGDTRPWYRRLWDHLQLIVCLAILIGAIWLARNLAKRLNIN